MEILARIDFRSVEKRVKRIEYGVFLHVGDTTVSEADGVEL